MTASPTMVVTSPWATMTSSTWPARTGVANDRAAPRGPGPGYLRLRPAPPRTGVTWCVFEEDGVPRLGKCTDVVCENKLGDLVRTSTNHLVRAAWEG
jgi:hypothetical protein